MTTLLSPPDASPAPPTRGAFRHRRRLSFVAAIAVPILLASTVCAMLGTAVVEHDSMSPTMLPGATVVFDRWSEPNRGDVVVVVDREGWSGEVGAALIKRVVGTSGDVIVCCDVGSGRLIINDVAIDEPYVSGERPGGATPFRVTVPEGTVWVMGDNRDASADSRLGVSLEGRGGVAVADVRGVVRAWWGGEW